MDELLSAKQKRGRQYREYLRNVDKTKPEHGRTSTTAELFARREPRPGIEVPPGSDGIHNGNGDALEA